MYAKGQGVLQDYVHAHKWLNLSLANGFEPGPQFLDLFAGQITPAQLTEAQRLAREWMEKHGK
jgi:TPR repeat protein